MTSCPCDSVTVLIEFSLVQFRIGGNVTVAVKDPASLPPGPVKVYAVPPVSGLDSCAL